ncbi:MAG: hypothetical protein M0P57_06830 [Syntrophales bacterium]|nr:hypothetical protein [Syntrophales bacterium]MDY0043608.1 hypothetical protein [Syntrophales bacterium]
MTAIAEWLDEQERQGLDITELSVPEEMIHDEEADETLFFQEIRPCSVLCTRNHPFAAVKRFDHWYYSYGREKENGPHTGKPIWQFFTKDKDLALKTAKMHI